jgi:predicted negative regulator of RcsB-dependent stress response
VEIYENDNEQVDALKRFFAENGKALAVGVILGIGALVGWRYWKVTKSKQRDRLHKAMKTQLPRFVLINLKR